MKHRLSPFVVISTSLLLATALPVSAALTTTTVAVDCNAGQTITAVLNAQTTATPLIINVSGTCNESVTIDRDDVSLVGTNASIVAPANSNGVAVRAAYRVTLDTLTITSSLNGVTIGDSPHVAIKNSKISGDFTGVFVTGLSSASIQNTTITPKTTPSSATGLVVNGNAAATLATSTISDFVTGVGVYAIGSSSVTLGSYLDASSTTISGNGIGVAILGNSTVMTGNAVIENNGNGVHAFASSTFLVPVAGTATVRNNQHPGIVLNTGSTAALLNGSTLNISGNGDSAVQCYGTGYVLDVIPPAKTNITGTVNCK
ncbi:MAG TPA: right-handed parallel beta-helix repeat-containing protein [Candidatus Acidoferrum sp.]|nr:right-handed parallel beta-helix repeat-containing protein [Candidatus Acidoferrum sp.]